VRDDRDELGRGGEEAGYNPMSPFPYDPMMASPPAPMGILIVRREPGSAPMFAGTIIFIGESMFVVTGSRSEEGEGRGRARSSMLALPPE